MQFLFSFKYELFSGLSFIIYPGSEFMDHDERDGLPSSGRFVGRNERLAQSLILSLTPGLRLLLLLRLESVPVEDQLCSRDCVGREACCLGVSMP